MIVLYTSPLHVIAWFSNHELQGACFCHEAVQLHYCLEPRLFILEFTLQFRRKCETKCRN